MPDRLYFTLQAISLILTGLGVAGAAVAIAGAFIGLRIVLAALGLI